jgi:hypothetical protein
VLKGIDATARGAAGEAQALCADLRDVLRDNRMCLCGMLASDYATLPKAMKEE